MNRLQIHTDFLRYATHVERRNTGMFYRALRSQIRQFILSKGNIHAITPDSMIKAFQRFYLQVSSDYFPIAQAEILSDENEKAKMPNGFTEEMIQWITEYLRIYRTPKIAGLLVATQRWIREIVSEGLKEGLTFNQIAEKMLNASRNLTMNRAIRIARTEGIAALNFTRFMTASTSKFYKDKTWLDSHDARVRPANTNSPFDHHAASIRKQPLELPFIVSGEQMMFPGDVSLRASAGNVINCRCTMLIETVKDAQGSPVRKPTGTTPTLLQELTASGNINQSLGQVVNELVSGMEAGNLVGQLF